MCFFVIICDMMWHLVKILSVCFSVYFVFYCIFSSCIFVLFATSVVNKVEYIYSVKLRRTKMVCQFLGHPVEFCTAVVAMFRCSIFVQMYLECFRYASHRGLDPHATQQVRWVEAAMLRVSAINQLHTCSPHLHRLSVAVKEAAVIGITGDWQRTDRHQCMMQTDAALQQTLADKTGSRSVVQL